MGDERAIPQPGTQYMGIEHKQLKSWTDAGEPADANDLGDVWKQMGEGLTGAAQNLMVAVFGSEAGWTGKAADAMRAQLQKVAEWSDKTGNSFTQASSAFVTQGESVGSAKTSMPEPVEYNPGQMIKDAATSGNPIKIAMLPYEMYKTSEASKEAHAEAAVVVARRDAQLAAAASSIPPFEAPPTLGGDKPKEPGPQPPGVPGGSGVPGGQGPGGGVGQHGPGIPAGSGGPGFGAPNPNGYGPNDHGPSNNNDQPPPNISVPSLPMGSGGGTGVSGFSPGNPSGFTPTGAGGMPGGPAAAGGGGGFGGAFGSGFGPGAAPRPGGGFGPVGPGQGAGANPGGTPGGPGAGAGARGGAGRGGAGAGMGGGHRGEGGEDEQHQRPSYLVEPDPDAMFGTDQMTAPPVIGG